MSATAQHLPAQVAENMAMASVPATVNMIEVIARAAADPNTDLDKMERLMAMHERMTARAAEVSFNAAMQRVQAATRKVKRDRFNEQTKSNYATLESVNAQVVPAYTAEGFSLSFGTDDCPLEGHFRVTCSVSHCDGHTRPYRVDIPSDGVGMKGTANKTSTHAFGSSMSYARRYLTLLIFNISLTDEDDDGNGAGDRTAQITADQVATLEALIQEAKADKAKFLDYLKCPSLAEIPADMYSTAVAVLNKKIRKGDAS